MRRSCSRNLKTMTASLSCCGRWLGRHCKGKQATDGICSVTRHLGQRSPSLRILDWPFTSRGALIFFTEEKVDIHVHFIQGGRLISAALRPETALPKHFSGQRQHGWEGGDRLHEPSSTPVVGAIWWELRGPPCGCCVCQQW